MGASIGMRLAFGLIALHGFVALAACEDSSSDGTSGPGVTLDSGVDSGNTSDSGSNTTDSSATDTGATDTGVDSGEPPLLPPDWFVNPMTGDDTNDGKSSAKPFKTLCKAREVVQANQVIGLMDGAYDNTTQRPAGWNLSFPCGPTFNEPVVLEALSSGKAVVKVPLLLNQGGAVRGIKLDTERGDAGLITTGSIQTSAGTTTIRSLSVGDVFSSPNAKTAPLVVSGLAKVTLIAGDVANYTTQPVPNGAGLSFAFVGGELTIEGGMFDDSAANNADLFCNPLLEGSGKVTLKGVTVHHKGTAIRATTGATVSFEQGSVLENRSTALNVGCVPVIGVLGAITSINLNGATVRGGVSGLETEPGIASGPVTITNSTFEALSKYAINLTGTTLKVRGSTIKSGDIGIRVVAPATTDLGTAGDVGGNTLTGATTALRVETTTVVNAAGNTWTANQQGADAQGKYAAELKVGPVTGLNFTLLTAAQSLQL